MLEKTSSIISEPIHFWLMSVNSMFNTLNKGLNHDHYTAQNQENRLKLKLKANMEARQENYKMQNTTYGRQSKNNTKTLNG